jgi:hypothetical protein
MDVQTPLKGSELVDCARVNAKFGVLQTTYQCGYGDRIDEFQQELKLACHHMGLHLDTLAELALTEHPATTPEISPQNFNQI